MDAQYENDNAEALANKLWLKVADLAALGKLYIYDTLRPSLPSPESDYYKAIENYERVAKNSVV